jgi:hypothetical protein
VSHLLDTTVISEVRKGQRCHPAVLAWWRATGENELFTSVLVIGEIRRGIERIRCSDLGRAQALENWLHDVITDFSDRILPVDRETSEIWGTMNAERTWPFIDGVLAATAVRHQLIFVTRNTRDMKGCGAKLLNPFDDQPR